MALTDIAIRAIKTTGEKQKIPDSRGLQLWVSEKGTRVKTHKMVGMIIAV